MWPVTMGVAWPKLTEEVEEAAVRQVGNSSHQPNSQEDRDVWMLFDSNASFRIPEKDKNFGETQRSRVSHMCLPFFLAVSNTIATGKTSLKSEKNGADKELLSFHKPTCFFFISRSQARDLPHFGRSRGSRGWGHAFLTDSIKSKRNLSKKSFLYDGTNNCDLLCFFFFYLFAKLFLIQLYQAQMFQNPFHLCCDLPFTNVPNFSPIPLRRHIKILLRIVSHNKMASGMISK